MWGWRIWDKEKRFLFLSSMDLFFLHISPYIHLPLASLKSSRSATQKEIILAELLAFFDRLCFPSTPCVLIVVEMVALWKACVYHTRKYPWAISYQRWIRNAEPRLTWTELFLSSCCCCHGAIMTQHRDLCIYFLMHIFQSICRVNSQKLCCWIKINIHFRFWSIQLKKSISITGLALLNAFPLIFRWSTDSG